MLLRGVDVGMPQNVRDEVNVPGRPIEIRAVGRTELVRRDVFRGRDGLGILFDHILHGPRGHALFLRGEEEGGLMTGLRDDRFPPIR